MDPYNVPNNNPPRPGEQISPGATPLSPENMKIVQPLPPTIPDFQPTIQPTIITPTNSAEQSIPIEPTGVPLPPPVEQIPSAAHDSIATVQPQLPINPAGVATPFVAQPVTPTQPIAQSEPVHLTPPKHHMTRRRSILYLLLVVILLGGLKVGYDHYVEPHAYVLEGKILGHSYATHTITVHDKKLSLRFDRSADVQKVNADSTILSGQDSTGNKIDVNVLSVAAPTDSTELSCSSTTASIGEVVILGASYPLCGSLAATVSPANFEVSAIFVDDGSWFKLDLTATSFSQAVNVSVASNIAQSIKT
jgi:hypothetical protein